MTKNKIGLVVAFSMILQIFLPIFYEIGEASGGNSFDQFITSLVIKKDRNGDELYSWSKLKKGDTQSIQIDKSEEVEKASTEVEVGAEEGEIDSISSEATEATTEPTIVVEPSEGAGGQDENQPTQEVESQEVETQEVEEVENEEVVEEAEEIEIKSSENDETDPSLVGDRLNHKALIDKGVGAANNIELRQGATSEEITINRNDSLFINYKFEITNKDLMDLQHQCSLSLPNGISEKGINLAKQGEGINEEMFITIGGLASLPDNKLIFSVALDEKEIIIKFGRDEEEFDSFKGDVEAALKEDITILGEPAKGEFGLEYRFTEEQKEEESITIEAFVVGGSPIIVNFEKKPEEASSFGQLTKSGSFREDEGEIEWTIGLEDVNIKAGDLIKFTDRIGQGHAYLADSLKITGPKEEALAVSEINYSKDDNQLVFSLAGPVKGPVRIRYSTEIKGLGERITDNSMAYKNKVKAQLNKGEVKEVVGRVDKEVIKKEGKMEGKDGAKLIDWTVTINSGELNLGDLEFSDQIEIGHSLVEGSIKVNGKEVSEEKLIKDPTNDKDIEFILKKVSEKIVITYQTQVDKDSSAGDNPIAYYDNRAFIKQGETEFSARNVVYHDIINKTGTLSKIPGEEYFIDWEIHIYGKDQELNGQEIVDQYGPGQELVKTNFKFYKKVKEVNEEIHDYTLDINSPENGFTFKFNKPIGSNEYTITYRTKITDPNMIGKNQEAYVRNTVSLGGYSAHAYVPIKSQVISKTAKDYDYATRTMNWEATINQNMMPIDQAIFKDTLGAGQTYNRKSIRIVDGDDKPLDQEAYSLGFTGLENQSEVMTLEFKGKITDQYFISYSTEVDQDYLKKENEAGKEQLNLSNSASLTGDQIIKGGVSATEQKEIKNSILTKEGKLSEEQASIKWQVNLNENHLDLGEVILKDKLQEGLDLDTTSVKLYEMSIDQAGKISLGKEVLDNLKTEYDNEEREIVFKFKSNSRGAYIIIFETDIVDEPNGREFINTIEFDGVNNIKESHKSQSVSLSGSSWANITGQGGIKGLIKVYKVNEVGQALAGAKIGLYDSQKELIKEETTDENGAIRFKDLDREKSYFIKEIESPGGYELDSSYHEIEIGERGIKNLIKSITIENKKLTIPAPEPEIEEKPSRPSSGGGSSSRRPRREREEDPVEVDPTRPVEPGQEPEGELEEDLDEKLLMDFNKEQEKLRQEEERKKKDQALEEEVLENQYQDLWGKDPKKTGKDKPKDQDLEGGPRLPKTGANGTIYYGLGLILLGLGLNLLRKKK